MGSPAAPQGMVRGLGWQYLRAAWAAELGEQGWASLAGEAGAPGQGRLDPFARFPLASFQRALVGLDARLGTGDGAVMREAGRRFAAQWARQYRSLARQVRGDPRRALEVLCDEVLPWLLDRPGAARVTDAGPAGVLARLPPELPEPFALGLLEGVVQATGVEGARVARDGERVAVAWEAAAAADARPGPVALLARAVRAPFLAASLVPVLLGAALAWKDGFLSLEHLGLTLLGVASFHLASNAANDYFDHRSRADEANLTPTRFSGGSRVIQRGLLSARAVLAIAAALYGLGAAVGLHIAFRLQGEQGAGLAEVLGLGVLGFLLGVLYSAPPARLAHRGLGELAVGLGFGPLLVAGSYLVQRAAAGAGAAVSLEALAYGVPLGALIAAVLYINQFPDRPWDARAGKRNLVVRLSPRRAVDGYAALLALAYASIAAAAVLFRAWPVLLALLTAPLAVRAWLLLRRHHAQPYELLPANAATLAVHLATGLLLLGGIVLVRWFPGA